MGVTYKYPRPAVTVDIILMRNACEKPEILLIQRLNPPFKDSWAFPGGFVDMDETLEDAATRELHEETGVSGVMLSQFNAYSSIDRDPRGRTISVIFTGIAKAETVIKAGDDAKNARWFYLEDLPDLAFDHNEIITDLMATMKLK